MPLWGKARIGLVQVYHLGGDFPLRSMMQCENFSYSFTIYIPCIILELFGRKSINMAMADFLFKPKTILTKPRSRTHGGFPELGIAR